MLLFGDERERVTLSTRGFITWILQLNPQIVQVSLREKLQTYQELIFDYLYGNVERETIMRQQYLRMQELQAEKQRINTELSSIRKDLGAFMEERLGQMKLQLSE